MFKKVFRMEKNTSLIFEKPCKIMKKQHDELFLLLTNQ
jgi:hypothetical protein